MAEETWIINKTPNLTVQTYEVIFTSYWSLAGVSGHQYSKIVMQSTTIAYVDSNNNSETVYNSSSGWSVKLGAEEPQRTITFDSSPTGDLLTWLQANAVKQGPVFAFRRRYNNSDLIGTGAYRFRRYSRGTFTGKTLLNKTWIANQTIELQPVAKTYNVSFYFYGTDVSTKRTSGTMELSNAALVYGAQGEYSAFTSYTNGSWVDYFCDVISFTGGTDINNIELIEWLNANGKIVDTITTLAGHTRKMNSGKIMKSFSGDSEELSLYALEGVTSCSQFTQSGSYILFYGVNTYFPVTYSGTSVSLTGTMVWCQEQGGTWWYRLSSMKSSPSVLSKNLTGDETPIIKITGGSSAAVLRLINWFLKNSIELEPDSTTETWIINESFEADSDSFQIEIPFTSGGMRFGQISGGGSSDKYYGLIYLYLRSDGIWQTFFPLQNGWTVDKYRTIIFDKPVTDSTLLSWLQKNAVKQ